MRVEKLFLWTPHWGYERLDLERCRASVPEGGRSVGFRQCGRSGKYPLAAGDGKTNIKDEDGNNVMFCKQHHPSTIAERKARQEAQWEAERLVQDEKYRRQDAIRKFIGYVKTDTIENLPTLSEIIDEHHDGLSLRELAIMGKK